MQRAPLLRGRPLGARGVRHQARRRDPPGGRLVAAHANLVVDEPDRPGFEWPLPFGAASIEAALRGVPGLRLEAEITTPVYRVQRFRRARLRHVGRRRPRTVHLPADELPPEVAATFSWTGATDAVPVAVQTGPAADPDVPPGGAGRIAGHAPVARDTGGVRGAAPSPLRLRLPLGHAGGLAGRVAHQHADPRPGRGVHLRRRLRGLPPEAWPLLYRYGFTATVFLVADRIGGHNAWDDGYGDRTELMGWDAIHALRGQGVCFGSHTATHPALTALSVPDAAREALRARTVLERELGEPIESFAYPYGDMDGGIELSRGRLWLPPRGPRATTGLPGCATACSRCRGSRSRASTRSTTSRRTCVAPGCGAARPAPTSGESPASPAGQDPTSRPRRRPGQAAAAAGAVALGAVGGRGGAGQLRAGAGSSAPKTSSSVLPASSASNSSFSIVSRLSRISEVVPATRGAR